MLITSVEKSKKCPDKLLVFVDGKYLFTISEEDYFKLNLYEEREISSDEIDNIKYNINLRDAKYKALKYITRFKRSEKEVVLKLENDGFDREIIDIVIEDLKEKDYINNENYARRYINHKTQINPKSTKAIKYELLNKGIDEEIINKVIEELNIDDIKLAEKLVRKKFGKQDLNNEKIIKKIYYFLKYRGFSIEIANYIINIIKIHNE